MEVASGNVYSATFWGMLDGSLSALSVETPHYFVAPPICREVEHIVISSQMAQAFGLIPSLNNKDESISRTSTHSSLNDDVLGDDEIVSVNIRGASIPSSSDQPERSFTEIADRHAEFYRKWGLLDQYERDSTKAYSETNPYTSYVITDGETNDTIGIACLSEEHGEVIIEEVIDYPQELSVMSRKGMFKEIILSMIVALVLLTSDQVRQGDSSVERIIICHKEGVDPLFRREAITELGLKFIYKDNDLDIYGCEASDLGNILSANLGDGNWSIQNLRV